MYDVDTGFFEQVYGDAFIDKLDRGKETSYHKTASASSSSLSALYLTDDCIGPVSVAINAIAFHTIVFRMRYGRDLYHSTALVDKVGKVLHQKPQLKSMVFGV